MPIVVQTFFGVEAPRSVFWATAGEALVCTTDLNHALAEGASSCAVCGAKLRAISIEMPSTRFGEICMSAGLEPAECFRHLCGVGDSGWEWQDDGPGGSGQSFRLYWASVETFPGNQESLELERPALGFRVGEAQSGTKSLTSVSYGALAIYDRAMREVSRIFGLDGDPKLYSQVIGTAALKKRSRSRKSRPVENSDGAV